MGRVYVARHGETDWNRAGRYQGQLESSLTQLGTRQALALARALAASGASRVVSSPLARCVETARPIAVRLGLTVETDPRLLEIAHGEWEGRLRGEIERDDAGRMRDWRAAPDTVLFPGGESLAHVDARWRAFADGIDPDGSVVVVTHDVLVRLALLVAGNSPLSALWSPRVENGAYAVFGVEGARWQILEECHNAHLEGLRADVERQAL